MTDDVFYTTLGAIPKGPKRAIVPVRRLLRKVLRPIFVRQAEILGAMIGRLDAAEVAVKDLHARHDRTSDQVQASMAFGWDYVAMARRLAALEDRVEALSAGGDSWREDEGQLSLPFPEIDTTRAEAC